MQSLKEVFQQLEHLYELVETYRACCAVLLHELDKKATPEERRKIQEALIAQDSVD